MKATVAIVGLALSATAMLPSGFARDPEPLEEYALSSLTIAWTDPDRKLAKLLDPRGFAHLVTLGSFVGKQHGEILHIGDSKVLVLELLRNGNGTYSTRTATIATTREQADADKLKQSFAGGVFGSN